MMQDEWRLIQDGLCEGRYNMAVDEALLLSCEHPHTPPTMRLYGWSLPTITVGHSQNVNRDVDLELALRQGVDVVRRPTGGRALWHGSELTYAVVAPLGASQLGHHLKDIFESLSHYLIAGLVQLGVPENDLALQNGARRSSGRVRSPACFAELFFGEITVAGKKLVGSAQRRTRNAFLQHGSILIGEDFDRFTRLCRYGDEARRHEACRRLREASTSLQQILSNPLTFEQVEVAMVEGFKKKLDCPLKPGKLSLEECALRDAILKGS